MDTARRRVPLRASCGPMKRRAGWPSASRRYEPDRPVDHRERLRTLRDCRISARWAKCCGPPTCATPSSLLEPDAPTRLIVFIDDMDGLRKVPESVPNREEMPRLPRPAGVAHPRPVRMLPELLPTHMIGMLVEFLKPVEVDYELMRSSEMYGERRFRRGAQADPGQASGDHPRSSRPTLRKENRAGWSPFMPLCPSCGQVNSTLVTAYHPERAQRRVLLRAQLSAAAHGCGFKGEQSVLGGMAKVQWKVDWALRWFVLRVDYELYGKDLIDSARLSGQIVSLLGGKPPLGFAFEMFLDEEGHKVSKSVGRGVTVDQWQRYAPIEVLKYFLILNPRRARKLFLEAIPQYVDEYLDATCAPMRRRTRYARRNSPLEFVLQPDSVRRFKSELSYGLIMNLVSALGTSDRRLIWNYLKRYDPANQRRSETRALAGTLVDCALNFYRDFVEPAKQRYTPIRRRARAVESAGGYLKTHPEASAEEIEKDDLRARPRALRQARQNFPADVPHDHGAGARPAPGRVHPPRDPVAGRTDHRRRAEARVAEAGQSVGARVCGVSPGWLG